MSTVPRRIAAAATLACLLLATFAVATPVSAAQDRRYDLFGSTTAGWGLRNDSLMSPGPDLYAEVGDNLTVNLTSVDGRTHRWFIDYDNDSAADNEEPRSPNFGPNEDDWVLYNITVSNLTGTFPYRSDRNPPGPDNDLTLMWGNITIANASAGSPFGVDALTLAIVGVVIFVVAIAVMVMFFRRQRTPPVPPPPEE